MNLSKEKEKALESSIIKGRNTLTADKLDMSFGEIISMYDNDELIFRSFQKRFHWNIEKRTQFIESLLLRFPVFEIIVISNNDTGKS